MVLPYLATYSDFTDIYLNENLQDYILKFTVVQQQSHCDIWQINTLKQQTGANGMSASHSSTESCHIMKRLSAV